MSLDRIKLTAAQILNRVPAVRGKSEDTTKQALVLPMLDALGFDIWNPAEVCLEYDADFAIKKLGQKEKVDIAVFSNGVPRIYIEVKSVDFQLEGHQGQLARYFNSTSSVTLGVITNGIEWRFFTDTGNPNMIDAAPFHIARLDAADQGLDVLARFAKPVFSAEAIRDYATELLYTAKIATFLRNELDINDRSPSEFFLRWMLKSDGMFDGVVNANVLDRFRPIAKAALARVFREIVRRSISAMEAQASQGTDSGTLASATMPAPIMPISAPTIATVPEVNKSVPPTDVPELGDPQRTLIVTTERELKFFEIAKAIFEGSHLNGTSILDGALHKIVPLSIAYKDTATYFGIYFNRPHYWSTRVVIEARKPYVGFNVSPEIARPLVPAEFTVLEPNALADFRVSVTAPEDLHALASLVVASYQQTVADRLRKVEVEQAILPQDGDHLAGTVVPITA